MICYICETNFISTRWYREELEIPLCDICLLEILKARKEIKLTEIQSLNRRVKDLKNRIKSNKEVN